MNKTQDILDATACLRQFQSAPAGCCAQDIALAQGLSVERCNDLLARLHHACLLEQANEDGYFRLSERATALDVLKAIWVSTPDTHIQHLYGATPHALLHSWRRMDWAQG
jgi:DNA-binding IclR family transcriptional regulator